MIDLYTERKVITKYNCESFIGHTVYMEEQLREQIKKLKETISSTECRVRNFLEYNDDHCLSEKLVLHHLDKIFAICTKSEEVGK